MTKLIGVTASSRFNTGLAPWAVVGHCLMQSDFLAPLHTIVQMPMRIRDFTPTAKLPDGFVSILAGCPSLQQINVRLRPDRVLAQAWRRERFAEQSTIADRLDACTSETIQQLHNVQSRLLHQPSVSFAQSEPVSLDELQFCAATESPKAVERQGRPSKLG